MAQWNKDAQEFRAQTTTNFEVVNIATKDGSQVDGNNPLPVSIGGESVTITGNVTIPGTVEISNEEGNAIPTHAHIFDENENEYGLSNPFPVVVTTGALPQSFHTLNNFDVNVHSGFAIQDDYLPVFGIRVEPGSGATFNLINFNIISNGNTSAALGYRWHMNPTLSSAYSWSEIGTSGIQYIQFQDVDGTPNEITSNTVVHSSGVVGKSVSELTEEMKKFSFTDGGIEMFLEIKRLDAGAKQDFWYDITMAKY